MNTLTPDKMDVWLCLLLSFAFPSLLILLLLLHNIDARRRLPPGPPAFPVIGNLFWLWRRVGHIEAILRDLRARYGPVVTLRIGSRPSIFIFDRDIAHRALVEHGTTFSDRLPPLGAISFINRNRLFISGTTYGPLWRLLRRNLISEVLHPSRVKLFNGSRQWVLGVLFRHLRSQAESNEGTVVAVESFRFAMFSLLVLMCFGERLDEKEINDIETMMRALLLFLDKLNVLTFAPAITKHIFRGRMRTIMQMRRRQRELFVPLIEARRQKEKKLKESGEVESSVYAYVDSLLAIRLPTEGDRQLQEEEIVSLCSEFLNAGTDTTSTALQWIMANIVKDQDVQRKLAEEIEVVVGIEEAAAVKEDDLTRMPYLKAVVLEGLRRHPPGHFVLPHTVTEDVDLDGYFIPRGAAVNVMVAEMAWDGKVWEDPMAFKPERFLSGGSGEGLDVTGGREIKMMPFGAGRRICPGLGLAMLHLEYFVANLVREFEWKTAVDGEEVDMSENSEFTVVMKNPLRARITPRRRQA